MSDVQVSVVIATLNRLAYLKRMIESVHSDRVVDARGGAYELIIVDGGSSDGTSEWLACQSNLVVIQQGGALGAVKAFNAGFAAAQGEYVVNLNDDAVLRPPVIRRACYHLEHSPQAAQIAIPFTSPGLPRPNTQSVRLGGKMWLYANFGVTRRALGDQVGWWGEDYYQYAGDTELSMRLWQLGYRVEPLSVARRYCVGYVEHLEVTDATRRWDPTDSAKFFAKWQSFDGGDANA